MKGPDRKLTQWSTFCLIFVVLNSHPSQCYIGPTAASKNE